MRVLLDTHVILWAAFRSDLLSPRARQLLGSSRNEVMVSAASAWEIATKFRIGKLPFARDLVEDFVPQVAAAGYVLLPISVEHALRAGRLMVAHRDPFDRMLAAQAIDEDLVLLSKDTGLDVLGARREW